MFCGQLHPYQEEGAERAAALEGILLAYGMGTGKTPIAIAALEQLMGEGCVASALLIVPASLRWQWAARIAQFADVGARTVTLKDTQLTVPAQEHCLVVDGSPARRAQQYSLMHAERRPDYVIVSYETATADYKALRRLEFDAILLDEAQAIKNPGAVRTKKIKRLRAPHRIALTGTPMDNGKPEEIYSLMEWVDPAVFGRSDLFDAAYVIRNKYGRAVGYRNLDVLHKTLSTAMVRKTIADPEVAQHMPQVVHTRVDVYIDERTRALYTRVENDIQSALEQVHATATGHVDIEALYSGGAQRGSAALGAVASRMLVARMLLCHPELVRISAAKYERARRKDDPGSAYAAQLVAEGLLDGLEHGEKLAALRALAVADLEQRTRKLIVFTAFREMLPLLEKALTWANPVCYHGELDAASRAAAIARFSQDGGCRVFLSTDAGGSGLDLPVASRVVNYDLPAGVGAWQQRNTRHTRANSAHRLVHIADLVAVDTVEEHNYTRLCGALAVAQAGVDNQHTGVHKRASLTTHLRKRSRWIPDLQPTSTP